MAIRQMCIRDSSNSGAKAPSLPNKGLPAFSCSMALFLSLIHILAYHYMGDFDAAMLGVVKSIKHFQATPVQEIWHNDGDQVLAYMRKDLIFASLCARTQRNGRRH